LFYSSAALSKIASRKRYSHQAKDFDGLILKKEAQNPESDVFPPSKVLLCALKCQPVKAPFLRTSEHFLFKFSTNIQNIQK
jgi:hypothetical protein